MRICRNGFLTDRHRDFAQPVQAMLIERIGAARFLSGAEI
jgi:hypothetical protein